MLRNIIFIACLLCSVCAAHWEIREVESSEDVDDMPADGMTKQKLPGLCWVCKWVMNKVKKRVTVNSTPDEIKTKLFATCDQIGFMKKECKKFIQKYMSTLVEELSTTDGPKTICTSIRACKSKSAFLKDFIL
ncbi:prosaposin-like [Triplophysa dalaica]|uniref:prosaposin-like n=1 Tax=Triplophysa dalaica TaxID=1582913 RepID=UPI0024DF99C4|nr:prosaposin-like [Triplophysa dalaica]